MKLSPGNDPHFPDMYTDDAARKDMAKLIAAIVSGIPTAIPEPDDLELASLLVDMINEQYGA